VFSRLLSLAIALWVGAMIAGTGFSHHWGRNSKFCIAVNPAKKDYLHIV